MKYLVLIILFSVSGPGAFSQANSLKDGEYDVEFTGPLKLPGYKLVIDHGTYRQLSVDGLVRSGNVVNNHGGLFRIDVWQDSLSVNTDSLNRYFLDIGHYVGQPQIELNGTNGDTTYFRMTTSNLHATLATGFLLRRK
jgi:hypothetical protein